MNADPTRTDPSRCDSERAAPHSAATVARAEVVQILASAVYRLIIEGRVRASRDLGRGDMEPIP